MSDFDAFYKKYFELNLKNYFENIDFEINKLVILITLALVAACIVISIRKNREAVILRKLLRSESIGEENAKTVTELGLSSDKAAIRLLSAEGGYLKSFVHEAGEHRMSYDEYIAHERELKLLSRKEKREEKKVERMIDQARFYLPKEMEEKAKRVYFKNTTSALKTALLCIITLSIGAAVFFLMPEILPFL